MENVFWINNFGVLFDKKHYFELYPKKNMTFESKLNAISRLVFILTILGYVITRNFRYILVGFFTLMCIVFIYLYRKTSLIKKSFLKEGMTNNDSNDSNPIVYVNNTPTTLDKVLDTSFEKTKSSNPLGNMLLPEIKYEPNRLSAPPSFNPTVYENVNHATKKSIQDINGSLDTSLLYNNLGDDFEFDQSMRNFYSNANTRVENDQGAFGQFLYGNMPSAKESTPEGAMARVQDNYRYILY